MIRTIAAAATALALVACSSSGGSSPTSSAASSQSAAAGKLAAKVEHGMAGLSSAHLDVDAGALGGKITGDLTIANGTTTASDLTVTQAGSTVELITAGGTTYGKLPPSHNTSGKPWVQVSSTSSNEFVRALAGTLSLTNAATSLGSVGDLLSTAATSVNDVGATRIDGQATEHYSLTIDASKVTGALRAALGSTGTKTVPVDLWVDGQGRPVQVKVSIPLGQQSLPLLVKVSNFNAPVKIAAPPADEVSTS